MKSLLIFIKNPIKGKVKTRIAATVGDDEALAIYWQLLAFTRHLATKINVNRMLFYSHFIDENDDWQNDFFQKNIQEGDDLGERMKNGFRLAFEKKSTKAIIIGSDCAELTETILNDAFEKLNEHDFVIGPADDGGYYLLGMSSFEPTVFDQIEWSTDEVLPKTIEKINLLNKKYYLLPVLSDTDTEQDWEKVKSKVQ